MKRKNVITYFGTQAKVADALGIKQPSVAEWGEIIPEQSALKLHVLTHGALKYDPRLYGGQKLDRPLRGESQEAANACDDNRKKEASA